MNTQSLLLSAAQLPLDELEQFFAELAVIYENIVFNQ
jgi:hypothetical protein